VVVSSEVAKGASVQQAFLDVLDALVGEVFGEILRVDGALVGLAADLNVNFVKLEGL
jgi:hypothetical protein